MVITGISRGISQLQVLLCQQKDPPKRDYSHTKNYSEAYANTIDDEVKRILTECYNKCEQLLTEHNDKLVLIAETLIKNEKINGARFLELMDENYDPNAEVEVSESEVSCEVEETSIVESTDTIVENENTVETVENNLESIDVEANEESNEN